MSVQPARGARLVAPLIPRSANGQAARPWTWLSRFESSLGNCAAAHGCGSAFVLRMARVGTGWRLSRPPDRRPPCLGMARLPGSAPGEGSTRMWRNGNASPGHGEVPGPIPGIRSQALVAECRRAGLRNLYPGRDVRVQVPPGVRMVNRTGVPGLAANDDVPHGMGVGPSAIRRRLLGYPWLWEGQADWRLHLSRKQASAERRLPGPTPGPSALTWCKRCAWPSDKRPDQVRLLGSGPIPAGQDFMAR
jgi:hypothetical protein